MESLILIPGRTTYFRPGESIILAASLYMDTISVPVVECPHYGCSISITGCKECDLPKEECINSPYTGHLEQCPIEIPKQWWEIEAEALKNVS